MNRIRTKPYYQCAHCIYFFQYYGLSYEMIHKLYCGHCTKLNKIIELRQRNCPYFEERTQKIDRAEKEKRALYVLTNIEKTLAHLKLYFNNDKPEQKVDDCLMDRLKD